MVLRKRALPAFPRPGEDELVILDEVHRLPNLFQNLRGLIDRGRRSGKKTGRFLLLGSASIDLLRQTGETLAGRPYWVLEAHVDGSPRTVNRSQVALVREEWRVVDRWWTEEPVSRRYFEVVLQSGENAVVFRDEERSCWFTQRGA